MSIRFLYASSDGSGDSPEPALLDKARGTSILSARISYKPKMFDCYDS